MKTIFQVILHGALAIIAATAVAQEQAANPVTADVWSFEMPVGVSSKAVFEQWRAQQSPGEPKILPLDGLAVPAREESTMVRVADVLTAPVTGDYAFFVNAPALHKFVRPDETELWILDELTGEWRLAQCAGNPNKRSGRTRLEQGVPRRFELWTAGRNSIAVDWEVVDTGEKDPATGSAKVKLKRGTVPSSALKTRESLPDDRHGTGLRDSWKQRHGLDRNNAMGPNGPWGDPDRDGLTNWQEQRAGTHPSKADTEGRDGLVRWELWRDIPGRYVFDLRRAAGFPTGPREVRFLDRLEISTGNGDRYGSRIRGLLKAPVDGEYTFKIIAHNSAELWLGETESWQTKRLIAKAEQPGAARLTWTRRGPGGDILPLHAEQIARVKLQAGRQYYLEILHKQNNSQDHCAVAWVRPGTETTELIDARHLSSWRPCPTDSDDDGLPDDWQRTAGLADAAEDPATRHAEADPDRDGACNRDEWLAGTDPKNATDVPASGGMLTSEAWTGIPGHRIAGLATHPRYPARPDFTTRIDNLDFGHEGENYGVRLRGYLTAPDDGSYRFAISGNNACILYLGETADKFTKRIIARVEHGTGWRFFTSSPTQQSGLVELERGRRYYIEVIFKRGENETDRADHSSVAWTRPGRAESVIAPEFFSPYQRDPRDLDDDDLPDDWEKLHNLDPAAPVGDHGTWGDPDADGLENFREFHHGRDPNTGDVHGTPGLALWEYWDDREDLMPALREAGGLLSERLWQDPRYPLAPVRREWRESLEAPRAVGINYASRIRALIVIPRSGNYVFAVSSHDASELFLSPGESKFKRRRIASIANGSRYREWHNHQSQVSAPVRLEAGARHYLEALHAQSSNPLRRDHLCVAWKPPGADKFEVIGAEHLVAFFRDPNDQDDDDLPDDWEKLTGLDPSDPHGDNGPQGDPDRDGMTNMEEYQLGSDPRNGDTDNDGVSDHDEIHVYGSDPLVKDVLAPVKDRDFSLDEVGNALSGWINTPDGSIRSLSRQSSVSLTFHVNRPGIYLLELVAKAVTGNNYSPGIPVVATVGRQEVGRANVTSTGSTNRWLTPWLEAGNHSVTINTLNYRFGQLLEIRSLTLYGHEGKDGDGNGIPDWLEPLMGRRSGIDSPLTSHVSPICLEGTMRVGDSVAVLLGGAKIQAEPSITGRWYVNVPLDPSTSTKISMLRENGAVSTDHQMDWTALDPLSAPSRIALRVGDSLKVAGGSLTENISAFRMLLDGGLLDPQPAGGFHILRFATPGRHVLETRSDSASGEISTKLTIDVLAADFGDSFHLASKFARFWSLPDVSGDFSVESGPELVLKDVSGVSDRGRTMLARHAGDHSGEAAVIARLPGGGAIAASTRINVFRLISSSDSRDARVVSVLPDGTRVVEFSFMIDGIIPDDLFIKVELLVPDAVFPNGGTALRLTRADFDDEGMARFIVYKAPGQGVAAICHQVSVYPEDSPDNSVNH